jgi:hypothetical protein
MLRSVSCKSDMFQDEHERKVRFGSAP